ncbi:threonine synthase-like 1 [Littorina saxatilis]|uniref:Threonine synthase N-terminal domain-containing protein n=1 Tax=Littorina saxatilis TaxID=31220 RepID=A0AAN9GDL5_9CAEN
MFLLGLSFVARNGCVRPCRPAANFLVRQVLWQNARTLTADGRKTWEDWRSLGEKANIVLIGSPGCGKTSTGRMLGEKLGMPVLDVDDHCLEPTWGCTVGAKLKEVGDLHFIEEEGKAVLNYTMPEAFVISTTGSNPFHAKAMLKLSQSGLVVFLDVSKDTVIRRLNKMKIDRIVGQNSAITMSQILDYRQEFYERWYDIRVIVEENEEVESIATKVSKAVDQFSNAEGFVSSRGNADDIPRGYVSFLDTVLQGLAPDGGLYVKSKHQPKFTPGELRRLVELDFRERSIRILEQWTHPLDLRPQEIRSFVYKSYKPHLFTCPEVAPVRRLVHNHYTLELFHGPTASFKDAALQLMPRFFVKAMNTCSDVSKYLIVVATSGDTGGAVLDGFRRHAEGARVGVLVLYPLKGISKIQHHQMTTMEGSNIKVVGVDSDFDFCQTLIKQVFSDEKLGEALKETLDCRLSAANSINWGRLLPQVVSHISGYLEMVRMGQIPFGQPVDLCVPTGNFGNILSAYYAKEMGIPVRRLICASNTNHVLTDFIRNGVYSLQGQTLQRTASPSIDILQSSNLERLLFHLSGEDPKTVRDFYTKLHREGVAAAPKNVWESIHKQFLAGYATEQDCKDITLSTFRATGYMMDPHTAVGRAVACHVGDPNMPTIISGTAHFAKFIDKILPFFRIGQQNHDSLTVGELINEAEALARQPVRHPYLEDMVNKPVVHHDQLPCDYDEIAKAIYDFAAQL